MKARRQPKASQGIEEAQAFTIALDISGFSKTPGEIQLHRYMHLKEILSAALTQVQLEISKTPEGNVFWSPGGDGGTLSLTRAGADKAIEFATQVAAQLRQRPLGADRGGPFNITVGLDRGFIYIGRDLNGSPNVWGDAINSANRIASTCDPGQILASEGFVEELRKQKGEQYHNILGTYQKRLAKHGRFFQVVNVHQEGHFGQPVPREASLHVADFEAPFRDMVRNYRAHLEEVSRDPTGGTWTLLLARRLYDMGELIKPEFFRYVDMVSADGGRRNPNHPRASLFSGFGQNSLRDMILGGKFQRVSDGAELCKQGDPAEELYVIAQGKLLVQVNGVSVAHRAPCELVGEMALIEPGLLSLRKLNPQRTASLRAEGEVTVFTIPYQLIRKTARSSRPFLQELVKFYSDRQKENVEKQAGCFQRLAGSLRPEDMGWIHSEGRLVGILPGKEKLFDCRTECLLVCCLGAVTVRRGRELVIQREPGGAMQALWITSGSQPGKDRIALSAETPSELVVWEGENWREWLHSKSKTELRGRLIDACGDHLL